jgi:hypothetical protein
MSISFKSHGAAIVCGAFLLCGALPVQAAWQGSSTGGRMATMEARLAAKHRPMGPLYEGRSCPNGRCRSNFPIREPGREKLGSHQPTCGGRSVLVTALDGKKVCSNPHLPPRVPMASKVGGRPSSGGALVTPTPSAGKVCYNFVGRPYVYKGQGRCPIS